MTTFNLDEYLGLSKEDQRSYYAFMWRNLFQHININPKNVNIPQGDIASASIDQHCRDYEKRIADAGGIDFQLLGIGKRGHIGFNECGASVVSLTHRQKLDESTRISAAGDFFGVDNVPEYAITMGIESILKARKIVLLAQGEGKSPIIQRAVEGHDTGEMLPANYLREHGNTTFIVDSVAATKLTRTKAPWVMGNEPNWSDPTERYKAIIWLAGEVNKELSVLTDTDYTDNHLGALLESSTDASTLNAETSEFLKNVLTNDPGQIYFDIMDTDRESFDGPLRVMSMSPHPDDTEISMGGAALRHSILGDEVTVAIQTSGNIAVPDGRAIEHILATQGEDSVLLQHIEDKDHGDPDHGDVLALKGAMRLEECRKGCEKLGINPDNVAALNLAFYETGQIEKDEFTDADVQRVADHLQEEQPHIINCCVSDVDGRPRAIVIAVAGAVGLEPTTLGFGDRCSSQLSYAPM